MYIFLPPNSMTTYRPASVLVWFVWYGMFVNELILLKHSVKINFPDATIGLFLIRRPVPGYWKESTEQGGTKVPAWRKEDKQSARSSLYSCMQASTH